MSVPGETGYYWLKLEPASKWQVVYVIRGEDVLFAGLIQRVTKDRMPTEYPNAVWGGKLSPPSGE